ncbi:MAG: FtsW/RodA/SpoVE family cell cycle protein [Christensenellaceae bacterium]|jgi:cell division protein FtsW (lipid II flippase)
MTIRKYGAGIVLTLMILFLLSAMLLLAFSDGGFDQNAVLVAVVFGAAIVLQYNILKTAFRHIDRFALLVADFLCILSVVMMYRLDGSIPTRQLTFILVGNIVMIITMLVIKRTHNFGKANTVFMVLGIGMLMLTFAMANVIGGAKNWLSIGGFTIQPSEFVKILFLIVSAYYLSAKKRKREMWPYFVFTILCVGILVMSRDLGAALLFAGTFLIVFFVATGNILITLGSVAAFAGGAYLAYKIFPHVRTRVEIWQDPWATYNDNGYQVVQGLLAIASGGMIGTGLGLGMPETVPMVHTDYIFAAICEEFGIIVAIAIIAMYLVFVIRGILIAMDARAKFDKLLVFGATIMLALQSFIIMAGVTKLIPLTGITLPFVSYGGSSMLSSMMLLGLIEGVALKNGEQDEAELREMGGGIE